MNPTRWSRGRFVVFVLAAGLLELGVGLVNRATAPELVSVRFSDRVNVEPFLHALSWLLLFIVPGVVLVIAWKRFDRAESGPEGEAKTPP